METSLRSREDELGRLKAVFARGGVRAALAYLNSLTPQRFTSLYQFDDQTLRNVTFFDREHPAQDRCDDIPVAASYCVFVRDLNCRFLLEHAERDERVTNHPKRAVVQCYCGVPLLDRDGRMFGSICHFDFKPGHIDARDVELLEQMAALLKNGF